MFHSVGHRLNERDEVALRKTPPHAVHPPSSIVPASVLACFLTFAPSLQTDSPPGWSRGKPRGWVGSSLLGTSGSWWWVWRCVSWRSFKLCLFWSLLQDFYKILRVHLCIDFQKLWDPSTAPGDSCPEHQLLWLLEVRILDFYFSSIFL